MRKMALSFLLIIGFVAYTVYVRIVGIELPIVAVPKLDKIDTSLHLPQYKDGAYIGSVIYAYYGNVQVKALISEGRIIDVQFLDYPQERQNSIAINAKAIPDLISEAIVTQKADVDTVSGASFTSAAFRESLESALIQAKI